MEIARLQDVQHAGPEGFVARPFLEGNQSNVRVIQLAVDRRFRRTGTETRT